MATFISKIVSRFARSFPTSRLRGIYRDSCCGSVPTYFRTRPDHLLARILFNGMPDPTNRAAQSEKNESGINW